MRFVASFEKTSAFDRHSDGTEFKIADNEPMAHSPSPGGMAPSGYEVYEPLPNGNGKKALPLKEKQRRFVVLGKLASPQLGLTAGPSRMDTAEGVSEQLKYETTGDLRPEREGFRNDGYWDKIKLRRKKK